ncbi:MAG: hypothetical protein N3B01_09245, partial [Verrucomicrobiae bacterium]|nr:hypothetical protein [Verrucomicrobiae bacterium]
YYEAAELPYSYLPVLLAAQFTEPVWILFFVGLSAALARRKEQAELLALTRQQLQPRIIPLLRLLTTP